MPRDQLIDEEKVWFRGTAFKAVLGGVIAIVVTLVIPGTLFYARVTNAFEVIQATIARDAKAHEDDRQAIVESIREVRDELRRMILDSVATRQAQTWIEMWQQAVDAWIITTSAQNPTLKVPPLKVPPLPR